jgi:hypothetical protein
VAHPVGLSGPLREFGNLPLAAPAATRIYDRYAYDKEKRDALERWARRLQGIVEGQTAKVVSIPDR